MRADPGYDVAVATAADEQPVSLIEAKAHLRILHASEDDLIERMVKAATSHVEAITGRALVRRTMVLKVDRFPAGPRDGLALKSSPVSSITSVGYVDNDGEVQTLSGGDYEIINMFSGSSVHLKPGKSWPPTQPGRKRSVTVTYIAGMADSASELDDDVEDLKNAILMLVEHFYYHRSAVAEGSLTVVPMAVEALLSPHKVHGWI